MSKLIYVTGAGRGIGRAIAVKLAKEGYSVAGCARSQNELEETQKLSENRIRISCVDVTDEKALENWFEREEGDKGSVPWGLVTAAGVYGPIGSFVENSWEEWRRGIEINLFGTALTTKIFAKRLIQNKLSGRIVLLSGGGATQPLPRFTNYCASKAATVRFGETLAHELADYGITVNSIAPGAVTTQLTEDLIKAGPEKAGHAMYEKALKQKSEGGTPPEKAADLTSYLMSDEASVISGRLLSAVWDSWKDLHQKKDQLQPTDIFTLRRIVPSDRGLEI